MKNNSLKFFTNNNLRDRQLAANNLFKRKYDVMGNIPVYKEVPINDSLLRNTDSLYEAIIEGSSRIVNNISSINTEMRIFANIDNYLQINPKLKTKSLNNTKKIDMHNLKKKGSEYINKLENLNNLYEESLKNKNLLRKKLKKIYKDYDIKYVDTSKKLNEFINLEKDTLENFNNDEELRNSALEEVKTIKDIMPVYGKELEDLYDMVNNAYDYEYELAGISEEYNNLKEDIKYYDSEIIRLDKIIKGVENGREAYLKFLEEIKGEIDKIGIEINQEDSNKTETENDYVAFREEVKQKLQDISNLKENDGYIETMENYNLLGDYDKYQQISNSIESGELDNNINLNEIERLLVFNDSNKEEYKMANRKIGNRPENFVLANISNPTGSYPVSQFNYKVDKNFSNSLLSNIIDRLSKCLTNIKTLNKLISKLQNKQISVEQKRVIFDSLKEIQDESNNLDLYDVVLERVYSMLNEKSGDKINESKKILVDFHKKFKYCIKTINSDMSKVSQNWENYERNYNQKF